MKFTTFTTDQKLIGFDNSKKLKRISVTTTNVYNGCFTRHKEKVKQVIIDLYDTSNFPNEDRDSKFIDF